MLDYETAMISMKHGMPLVSIVYHLAIIGSSLVFSHEARTARCH